MTCEKCNNFGLIVDQEQKTVTLCIEGCKIPPKSVLVVKQIAHQQGIVEGLERARLEIGIDVMGCMEEVCKNRSCRLCVYSECARRIEKLLTTAREQAVTEGK